MSRRLALLPCAVLVVQSGAKQAAPSIESCFLLYEIGAGEMRRDPSDACRIRITPASTFKVPRVAASSSSIERPALARRRRQGLGFVGNVASAAGEDAGFTRA